MAAGAVLARCRIKPTPHIMKSVLLTLVFTASVTVASAQLINPDFETGDFTGWTASGGGAQVRSAADEPFAFLTPFEGRYYASFIGLSSIVQTASIHLSAGETVSVWMNGTQSTLGRLDIFPESGMPAYVHWKRVESPNNPGHPIPWNQVSYKIPQDGIYSIGVSNLEPAESGPLFLGIDLFTITPVPEPSSYGLLAAVSVVAAIIGRRRKALAAAAT